MKGRARNVATSRGGLGLFGSHSSPGAKHVIRFVFGGRQLTQSEEKAMAHMNRGKTMACVLVAITLIVTWLCGSTFATSENDLRLIVTFTPLGYPIAPTLVTAAGASLVHKLSSINAWVIKFPPYAG